MMQFIHFMILMHCLQLELTGELDLYEPHPPIHAALFPLSETCDVWCRE